MGAAHTTLWVDLGTEEYLAVLGLQRSLSRARRADSIPDVVLMVEHPACITMGRGGSEQHLLAGPAELEAAGIPVHHVERGGDVTYHGPGQLVWYPIVDLRAYDRDVHAHVRRLEEVMIRTAAALGVPAHRDPAFPGAWTAQGKIGAVGIGVRRWVTTHGAALNVQPRMDDFGLIVPCGIVHRPVASFEGILGHRLDMTSVRRQVRYAYAEVFETEVRDARPDDIRSAWETARAAPAVPAPGPSVRRPRSSAAGPSRSLSTWVPTVQGGSRA